MSPGSSTESYPAFARIGLRENPGKNLNQVTCPDRDSNPGHLVSRPDALTVTPQDGGRKGSKKSTGTRNLGEEGRGRPRNKWEDAVREDARSLIELNLPRLRKLSEDPKVHRCGVMVNMSDPETSPSGFKS
ncbi:hypothetical protein ANN_17410 [Periplaneta americana]|uniref:Uncharacterized protein n=1 Tax=Periplaneta americana TaxID=6978 RepID=A0ABQ8STF9_PERAM|nr:hypothetical protein ANN_17410 [Periplaneta americana]